jgi:hypothetical protein
MMKGLGARAESVLNVDENFLSEQVFFILGKEEGGKVEP